MEIKIRPKKVLTVLTLMTFGLALIHLVTQVLLYKMDFGSSAVRALNTFYMANEISVPTWYNQILIFIAFGVAFMTAVFIRRKKGNDWKYWGLLSLVMLFLSVDEGSQLHEQLGFVSYRILKLVGLGGFSTTYYYLMTLVLLVVIVGGLLFRFWWRLPKKTKITMLIAGLVYVGGAAGVEAIGQYSAENTLSYSMLVVVEESMEMMGMTIFIYAVLEYLQARGADFRLKLSK